MHPRERLTKRAAALLSILALIGTAACTSTTDDPTTEAPGETPEVTEAADTPTAEGEETEAPANGDYTIALVPGMTAHPAYQTLYCGALEAAEELGVSVEFQGANAWDPAQQIPVVQSLLATSPDALLLVPADSSSLRPVVDQYLAADIPVITIDTGLEETDGLTAVISSDNIQGGSAAAEALGEAIEGQGTVGIISGVPGATTDNDRMQGFIDTLNENYPDVEVLEPEFSRSVVATAESQVQALMLAHPDLTGVFGVNGNSATGAANAVVNAGRQGEIVVAGYDAEPGTVEQLRAGNISILVVQDFIQEGRLGVQFAVDALNGAEVDDTPVILENIIATTDNADDPEISQYFYIESCL